MGLSINFQTAPCNAQVGAIYTQNAQNFTVVTTVADSVVLSTLGTGLPAEAGVLTLSSGTGDASISYSSFTVTSKNVLGVKEGILLNNKQKRNVAPLINAETLQRDYLFGINLVDRNGDPMSAETIQLAVDNAASWLEHYLDIHVIPYLVVEDKDYRLNDYAEWGYIPLNEYPVISFVQMEMVYFRDQDGVPETIQVIPNNWIRLQNHDGIVRLIPNARFPATLQIDQSGNFFPEVLRSNLVPHLWRLTYWAGFDDGAVPMIINQAIGLLAAINLMAIDGIAVFGPGIASTSLSIDGLSQNIATTNNSESSAYSSVIAEYRKLLFGEDKEDHTGILYILKDFYKGETMGII
jgi:hypothetical protein